MPSPCPPFPNFTDRKPKFPRLINRFRLSWAKKVRRWPNKRKRWTGAPPVQSHRDLNIRRRMFNRMWWTRSSPSLPPKPKAKTSSRRYYRTRTRSMPSTKFSEWPRKKTESTWEDVCYKVCSKSMRTTQSTSYTADSNPESLSNSQKSAKPSSNSPTTSLETS